MIEFPLLPVRPLGRGWVVRTPAKLNLFLEVVARRADGFHDLETLFLAVDYGDTLWVEPASDLQRTDSLTVRGVPVPTDQSNLVSRALSAARRKRPIPPLSITLRKRIAVGAGLGGGSGNGAGMLALLESLAPDPEGLHGIVSIGKELGSDVPFFFSQSGAAVGRGRGDQLSEAPRNLFGGDEPVFVIAIPSIASSTAHAFRTIELPLTLSGGPITFPARTFELSGEWQRGTFNRLEAPVLRDEPRLAEFAQALAEVESTPIAEEDIPSSASTTSSEANERALENAGELAKRRLRLPSEERLRGDESSTEAQGEDTTTGIPTARSECSSSAIDRESDVAETGRKRRGDFSGGLGSADSLRSRFQMTGSGSAFYAIAESRRAASNLVSALEAPTGPVARWAQKTGHSVSALIVRPHPSLL